MNKYSAIVLMGIALWTCSIQAGVIIVAADGTGQVTSIQAGINLAAVGDTVLISPGVWTGVVVIDNKPITIGSYYITDGDTTHISQTIIDGEDIRTGIIIKNCSGAVDTLKVIGLTLRNCRSNNYPLAYEYTSGGGIGVMRSIAEISKCVIQQCRAYYGGGISVIYSTVFLRGNEIFGNVAENAGGGISAIKPGTGIIFDQNELNSVYLNYSSTGCDIAYAVTCNPTVIYLGNGSVTTNDPYFYFCPGQTPIFINQGMINQVNYDLWVSPLGSNTNTGLSPNSPLKNISFALAKIQPSGNTPLTVHVLPGTYSWSQTGEALPLQPKSYVNIIGADMESTILDGERYSPFIIGIRAQDHLNIYNFTLINGFTMLNNLFFLNDTQYGETEVISVGNIHIKDAWAMGDAFRIMSCHNLTVNNLIIEDSQVSNGFDIYVYETGNFSNFRVQRLSSTNYDMYNSSCCGCGIAKPLRAAALQTTINISNFLITDIVDTSQFWPNSPSGLSIAVEGGNCDLNINNCTIANNSSVTQSGGLNITLENCNIQVNNTIVSGNTPYEVAMFAFNESTFADVSFNNCLVSGGSDSFFILGGDITHTWMDGNMFGYPSFLGGDTNNPLYYSLASNSPCIDSGTPDTANLDLPPYDLAGNWRIWNGRIDMGCYEYDSEPWVDNDDPFLPQPESTILLQNYPNPFNPTTTISYQIPKSGSVKLEVYNLKGQLVKTLIDDTQNSGIHGIIWNGTDSHNRNVASGVYLYRLSSINNVQTKRMLLMK